jgi:coenzyme F420 biosynthesis associated uncharacterized protein
VETLPLNWKRAADVASALATRGPVVSRDYAEQAVAELQEGSVLAERHVRELTGLGEALPLRAGEVVDRPGWARSAAGGLAAVTDGALPTGTLPKPVAGALATTSGAQLGVVLALLAGRVLGQYDPFSGPGGEGSLLLVAPNVVAAELAMEVPSADFRLWVCLHEGTHRLQFTAVPWLRDYFSEQVKHLLAAVDEQSEAGLSEVLGALVRRLRAGERPRSAIDLVGLLQTPEQRATLERLLALSTLLEGHADHVMDAVGPDVVPSVARIRQRFTERRRGGSVADRLLRSLLGLDEKLRQYAEGAAFTRAVVRAVGMPGFNAVWTSPETLPSRAELADPRKWLRRVHG